MAATIASFKHQIFGEVKRRCREKKILFEDAEFTAATALGGGVDDIIDTACEAQPEDEARATTSTVNQEKELPAKSSISRNQSVDHPTETSCQPSPSRPKRVLSLIHI